MVEMMTAGECPEFIIVPIQFASSAIDPIRFHNKASEMWWRLRGSFKPDSALPMVLPGHHPLMPKLEAQLSGARYAVDSKRRIWVDKTGGGRYDSRLENTDGEVNESPDLADALGLALEAWVQYYGTIRRTERTVYEDSFLGSR